VDKRDERSGDRPQEGARDRGEGVAGGRDGHKDAEREGREAGRRARLRDSADGSATGEAVAASARAAGARAAGASNEGGGGDALSHNRGGGLDGSGGQRPAKVAKVNKDLDPPEWATAGDETWVFKRLAGQGPDRIGFHGRSYLTVGRSSKASEQLQSATCSGLHAMIAFRGGDEAAEQGTKSKVAQGRSPAGARAPGSRRLVDKGRVCLRDLASLHGTWVQAEESTDKSGSGSSSRPTRATSDTWTVIALGSTVTFGDKTSVDHNARYQLCRHAPQEETEEEEEEEEKGKSYEMPFAPSPALRRIVGARGGGKRGAAGKKTGGKARRGNSR